MGLDTDMRSLKRSPLQILRWGRRIACITSTQSASYTRMSGQMTARDCCQTWSFLIKQLVWRIRSRCKQFYLRRMKGNPVKYSYDPQSYSQNFDNGRPLDRPSRFAP